MNWASRRAVLEAVGLFDVGLRRGEDGDLSYRIREHGYSFAYAPEAIVYHRNQRTIAGLCARGLAARVPRGPRAAPARVVHYRLPGSHRRTEGQTGEARAERAASGPAGRAEDRSYERAFAFGKRTGRASGRVWFTFSRAPSEGRIESLAARSSVSSDSR